MTRHSQNSCLLWRLPSGLQPKFVSIMALTVWAAAKIRVYYGAAPVKRPTKLRSFLKNRLKMRILPNKTAADAYFIQHNYSVLTRRPTYSFLSFFDPLGDLPHDFSISAPHGTKPAGPKEKEEKKEGLDRLKLNPVLDELPRLVCVALHNSALSACVRLACCYTLAQAPEVLYESRAYSF